MADGGPHDRRAIIAAALRDADRAESPRLLPLIALVNHRLGEAGMVPATPAELDDAVVGDLACGSGADPAGPRSGGGEHGA